MGAALLVTFLPMISTRLEAATPAGVTITNVAAISFEKEGEPSRMTSNPASLRVQETLDIALARIGDGGVPVRAGQRAVVPFELVNAGNGTEAFAISATVGGIDAIPTGFAIDRNGDGRYDPATDTMLGTDAITPVLGAGAGLRLLVLVDAASPSGDGVLRLSAHAVTGYGKPGTVFPAMGDGGVDAVVGETTAMASLQVPLAASADAVVATLVKSQAIRAPDGSDSPVHGATITYSIDARFVGSGPVTGARIVDPIPDGTDYVPGSLRVGASALTDAAGDDAGEANASGIDVALGDVVAPATRSVSFQVKIK